MTKMAIAMCGFMRTEAQRCMLWFWVGYVCPMGVHVRGAYM